VDQSDDANTGRVQRGQPREVVAEDVRPFQPEHDRGSTGVAGGLDVGDGGGQPAARGFGVAAQLIELAAHSRPRVGRPPPAGHQPVANGAGDHRVHASGGQVGQRRVCRV
jgi:hypothetical protein